MSDEVKVEEIPGQFERWLAGRPLAERSRREYARNVRAYCVWLTETPDRGGWLPRSACASSRLRQARERATARRRANPSASSTTLSRRVARLTVSELRSPEWQRGMASLMPS